MIGSETVRLCAARSRRVTGELTRRSSTSLGLGGRYGGDMGQVYEVDGRVIWDVALRASQLFVGALELLTQ